MVDCWVVPRWDYLGYLAEDGTAEHFGLIEARKANWHHSYLVRDLKRYDLDSTLRYGVVRAPSPPHGLILQLSGEPALNPYGSGETQIERLAVKLVARGMLPEMPVYFAQQHYQTLHEGKRLGIVADWLP